VDLTLIRDVRDAPPQTFMGAMWDAAFYVGVVENVTYVIFAAWTAAALGWTMRTLRTTRQSRKLGRYLLLAAFLLVSALGAAVVAAVAQTRVARDVRYALLQQKAEGAIFFVALAGVALLWRPNESAREYAYSTQLPASPEEENPGEGDDDDGNDPDPLPRTEDERNGADDAPAAAVHGAIELPRVSFT
jgi:hypothetical protein